MIQNKIPCISLLHILGCTDTARSGNGSSISADQARQLPCSLYILHAVLLLHLWTDWTHLQPASEQILSVAVCVMFYLMCCCAFLVVHTHGRTDVMLALVSEDTSNLMGGQLMSVCISTQQIRRSGGMLPQERF